MKSNFAIAYSNKDGKDLNGIPWIFDDVDNKDECILKASEMIGDGFKNVIPFQFDDKRRKNIEEPFCWDYVKKNKINNE